MDSTWSYPTATIKSYSYTYGKATWGDLLTKFNGETITYDKIGNPLTYRDGITMTWQNGRELKSLSQNGKTLNFTYDPSGLRTKKTVNVVENDTLNVTNVEYVYEGSLLMQMKRGSIILDFNYDANGSPIGFAYRSTATSTPIYFYYGLNSRGDVVALYSSTGVLSAIYDYDAYGGLISVKNSQGVEITSENSIPIINPLRYRGYVYDTETGLYYLQSRYYDPVTCRFINADSYVSTGQGINGYNMFAYCNNNPVMYSDPTGTRIFECCPYSNCQSCRKKRATSSKPDQSVPVASYSEGDIYIIEDGEADFTYSTNDIIVSDFRVNNDEDISNFTINDSYRIQDTNIQTEIIMVLLEYEEKYPTQWDRSLDSMLVEWDAHNDVYYTCDLTGWLPAQKEQARSVSFDNQDEDKNYYDHTIGRLLS